jgi:C4-dicarboxylate-specific signal transduction histidine kinase
MRFYLQIALEPQEGRFYAAGDISSARGFFIGGGEQAGVVDST